MNILVTGGAGYIGSHTVIELLAAGHTVIVIDSLTNSNKESLSRVEEIAGASVVFYDIDLKDKQATSKVFSEHVIDAVIHFAALKAVGESVKNPLRYYDNNLISTLSLLAAMQEHTVKKLVFSSSATVYGDPGVVKYTESLPIGRGVTNPYGQTKCMIEQIIQDLVVADPDFEASILRYFNPIGAHESGKIGEDPSGTPNNLMPFITQVATGQREYLSVFGDDYPTPDGTCRRDYIHVVDLARGHLEALQKISPGAHVYNLGSGEPVSVLELVHTFIEATGQSIPYKIAPRREGDLPEFYADPTKANTELGWKTEKTIRDACIDAWRWQSKNPNGYTT